jgi:hypothetical protein
MIEKSKIDARNSGTRGLWTFVLCLVGLLASVGLILTVFGILDCLLDPAGPWHQRNEPRPLAVLLGLTAAGASVVLDRFCCKGTAHGKRNNPLENGARPRPQLSERKLI